MAETLILQEKPLRVVAHSWPVTSPRGGVVLIHGLGEHSGRYAHVAQALNEIGLSVLAPDLPGHGRSGGRRGHFPSYEQVLDLIGLVLDRLGEAVGGRPLLLYGHSLGGNLVINYTLRRPQGLRGAVASGPWLRLAIQPPRWRVALARTVGRLLPAVTQPNGLDPHDLSHDPQVVQAYIGDPLVHDRISAGLFLSAYQAGLWALENATWLQVPLLLMHGTADRLTSPEASAAFCARAGSLCTLRLWEGLCHEVHNEPQKAEVLTALREWLESILASPAAA
ncbi:MAG TPA: alpha/beta hydrolase [Anaerolineae bacterium]|nr:alpha/beta hydrolase [Anaerolineae bacterium]HID84602.1 alpha/beta hydrolase [Anaerolineales bacterium]HIQ08406.1 alpha/beta hydrolase [Anaerolineaceae bacterium]